MDFKTLARRDLQALCKKNRIPANMTNLAMADALQALPSVEGIEEFLPAKSNVDVFEETREQQASPLPRARRVAAKASDIALMASEGEEAVEETKEDAEDARSPEKKPPCTLRRAAARRASVFADPREQLVSPPPCARRNASKEYDEATTVVAEKGRATVGRSTRRGAGKKEEAAEGTIDNPVEITDTPAPKTTRRATARKAAASVVAEENKDVPRTTVTTRRTRQSAKTAVDVVARATTRMSTRAKVSKMASLASEEEQQAEKEIGEVETASAAVEEPAEEIPDAKSSKSVENIADHCPGESQENVIASEGNPDEVAVNEESPEINNDASSMSKISEEHKEEVGDIPEIGDFEITNASVEKPVDEISPNEESPDEIAENEESPEIDNDSSSMSKISEEHKEVVSDVTEIGDFEITNASGEEPVDEISPNEESRDEIAANEESLEVNDDASSMSEVSEESKEEVGNVPQSGNFEITNASVQEPIDEISDERLSELMEILPEICSKQSQENAVDFDEQPSEVTANEESMEMSDDDSSMSELSEESMDEAGVVPEIRGVEVTNVAVEELVEAISDDKSCESMEDLPEMCSKQPQENVVDFGEVPNEAAVDEESLEINDDASSKLPERNKEEVGSVPEIGDVEIANIAVEVPVSELEENLPEICSKQLQENVADFDEMSNVPPAANEESLEMNDDASPISVEKKEVASAPAVKVPGEKLLNFTENFTFSDFVLSEKSVEMNDAALLIYELSAENKEEVASAPVAVSGEKRFNFMENSTLSDVLSEEKSIEGDGNGLLEKVVDIVPTEMDEGEAIVDNSALNDEGELPKEYLSEGYKGIETTLEGSLLEELRHEEKVHDCEQQQDFFLDLKESPVIGLISDFQGMEINGGISDEQNKTADATPFSDVHILPSLDQYGSSIANAPHETEEQAEILAVEITENALEPSVETSLEMANVTETSLITTMAIGEKEATVTKRPCFDADKENQKLVGSSKSNYDAMSLRKLKLMVREKEIEKKRSALASLSDNNLQ